MLFLQMCASTMGAPTSRVRCGMMGVPTPVNASTALKENTCVKKGKVISENWSTSYDGGTVSAFCFLVCLCVC